MSLMILKLKISKDIVLNLDATGSLISKPPPVLRKYFTMPSQYNTRRFLPVPFH